MSIIVSGVLKHTFGFFASKIRKEIGDRLKDGDVTDEVCRRLIVTELDDIISKLDGLARKDLLSSLYFLQEGVNRLYESLLHFPSDVNTAKSTEGTILVEESLCPAIGPVSVTPINEAVALINAITSLRIHSNERFNSAIKSFELAREKATEAFGNGALSIEERIQASGIRMMARMLENLEDPDASVSDCLQYLRQLHDLGAIREIFSVLIDGGFKSLFNQTKRLQNALSVHVMNQILFDFVRKFAKTYSALAFMFRWPMVLLRKKFCNPLFGERNLVGKLEESGVQVTSPYPDFTFDDIIDINCSAVNSKRDIIAKTWLDENIAIFQRSGESRTLCEVPMEEHAFEWQVAAMDVDAEDNIYVITAFRESDDQSLCFKLIIFDENGNKNFEIPLSFYQKSDYPEVRVAIKKDGRIAILNYDEKVLYVGRVCVETKTYEVDKTLCCNELNFSFYYLNLRISDLNETKIIVSGASAVYVFTENGLLPHKIEIPGEHGFVQSVVIDHVTKHTLVKTYRDDCSSLLSFSECGELLHSSYLGSSDWIRYAMVISHPNGAVALVGRKEAVLLQW